MKNLVKSKNHDFPLNSRNREVETSFFIPKARLMFIQLKQAFIKAAIFYHFDPKCHIWIEIDASGYAIGGILSQLVSKTRPDKVVTKIDLSQWQLIAFFFRKMILVKT